MIKKETEKRIAIKLRKQGRTYSQILSVLPVAKSTLALWLQSVGLSRKQKQRITEARLAASLRGGKVKKNQRIQRQIRIILKSKAEIRKISKRELFLIGVALYWAEGSKEKEYRPGSPFEFLNMDPKMIKVFIIWLTKICKINRNMLIFDIFLHQMHKDRILEVKKYWSKITGFTVKNFQHIYFKKNRLKETNRKNTAEKYYGILKIKVRRSSALVRKTAGWSEGIFEKVIENYE